MVMSLNGSDMRRRSQQQSARPGGRIGRRLPATSIRESKRKRNDRENRGESKKAASHPWRRLPCASFSPRAGSSRSASTGSPSRLPACAEDGLRADRSGNYPLAVDKLKLYLTYHPDDREALIAYVDARPQVESESFQHIIDTVRSLRYLFAA